MSDATTVTEEKLAASPEGDPRPALAFANLVLVQVVEVDSREVEALFYSSSGAREPGRPQLAPDIHWFRCRLSREEPLIELLLDGGFYMFSEFSPRGMELGEAFVTGRVASHAKHAFPEAVALDAVKVTAWRP